MPDKRKEPKMRKFIIGLILVLMLIVTGMADITVTDIREQTVRPERDLAILLRKKFAQHNTDVANMGQQLGTGKVFYVDSNVTTAGTGNSVRGAVATLDEVVVLCQDNRGDIVYILQGHTETFTAADSADLDVIGVTYIGLGTGTDRPTFTYDTGTAGEIVIAAANVTIRNLVFVPGIANVVHAIEVEADGDGSIIENCEFQSGTTDAFEFVDAIEVTAAAHNLIIRFNKAEETTAGAARWLDIEDGILDNLFVYGNNIYGDYSAGAIAAGNVVHTLGYYGYNTITNLNAADFAFEFTGNATGVLEFNTIFAAAEATAIDPGSMACFENYVTTTTDVSGMITPIHDDGTTQLNATTVTAISSAVDALAGIGMIGICDENVTATTVDCAALGGFGDDAFLEGWSLMCIFDTGGTVGTAPSGQIRDITDYVSTGGTFTVDTGFTAALTAGDFVLLTPTHLIPKDFGPIRPKTIYCDDGGSGGEATNWQNAVTTFIAAEALANAGDTILIGENHNENWTNAANPVLNVAGVSVIGMGKGDSRPLFDYDSNTTVVLTVDAAGCTLKNLRFRPGVTLIAVAVRVEDEALGLTIDGCSFEEGEGADEEFITCISVDAAASGLTVKNCTAVNANATAGDSDTWLNLDEIAVTDCSVIGNTVFGTFDEACVWWDSAVPINLLVKDNVLSNLTSGQMCIEGTGAATGMCVGNAMFSDTLGAVLDPGSLKCVENYAVTAIDESAVLVPRPDTIAGQLYTSIITTTNMNDTDLFDVDGGDILITSFVGVVLTNIVNAAGSVKIFVDVDNSLVDYDLSTAVDMDNDQAGQRVVFSDANASALTPLATNGGTILMSGWYCLEGMIELDNTDEDATGTMRWSMTWIPYIDGVTVTSQ
jgi:hypothetical protein